MTHSYNITGMTCGNCLRKAKSALLKIGDITEAELQLTAPQATITMQRHVPLDILQNALNGAGNYVITEPVGQRHEPAHAIENTSPLTYKPIYIIAAYITGITLLIEAKYGFNVERWMQHFMAGFFIVFCFFKVLNLKGFAESYATYDIIAKRWMGWGYVYAYIELGLGISYLLGFAPIITNAVTFVVMSISLVGVLQAVFNKRKIQCACLGAVFNLPMSTITIIEDTIMIIMSAVMLLSHSTLHF